MLPAVLAASLGGLTLPLELPEELPAPGQTLFARAGAPGPVPRSAEAQWLGRTIRLQPEPDGRVPVLLGVPLEARDPLSLVVTVVAADGAQGRAEAEIRLAPRVRPADETWEIAPEVAALLGRPAAEAEAISLLAALALAEPVERFSWTGLEAPVLAPRIGRFGAARTINGLADGGEEAPLHRGIDYALRRGASVRPPAPGVVVATPTLPLLGECVIVGHGHGVASLLAHLESALVLPGDRVTRDSVVGFAADTGLSDRTMLHYAVFVHGVAVDPAQWTRPPAWLREPSRAGSSREGTGSRQAASSPAPAASLAPPPSPPAAPPPPVALASPPALTAPAPTRAPAPVATPAPAATPELPAELPAEQLAALVERGIAARLPGVLVEVAAAPAEPRAPWDLEVRFRDLGRFAFYTAVEVSAFVAGELTARTRLRTGKLHIGDPSGAGRVVLLTRDARQLWREKTGLATPAPRDDH